MALIKLGSIVTRISGKVGGQQFGTTSAGHYMKNSGTPRKAITLLQQTKMQRMGTTAQGWRSLTPTERQTYKNASPQYPYLNRVGETKYYSGYAIYAMLRNNQENASVIPVVNPLPKFSFTQPLQNAIAKSGVAVNWRYSPTQASCVYRIHLTRPLSTGVTVGYPNHYYVSESLHQPTGINKDIGPDLIAKFGSIPSGLKFFYRVDAVHMSSGQIFKGIATGSFIT